MIIANLIKLIIVFCKTLIKALLLTNVYFILRIVVYKDLSYSTLFLVVLFLNCFKNALKELNRIDIVEK